MPKYEYKVLAAPKSNNDRTIDYSKFQAKLNGLGKQGWKVVGTGGAGSGSEGSKQDWYRTPGSNSDWEKWQ